MKKCKKCGNEEVLQNGLCSICIGIQAKETSKNINNAEHPARKKAIRIIQYIEENFDIKFDGTEYYDVEDKLTNIINEKE